MEETTYDIYFTGEVLDGFLQGAVKKNLGKLFNADEAKINAMFSGKPILLKKGLDKETAQRFAAAMKKAGAKAVAKINGPIPEDDIPAAGASGGATPDYDMTIAPAGSDVLAASERHEVEAVEVDISAITLASQFDAPAEMPKEPPPPAPDTSHITTAEVGSDMGEIHKDQTPVDVPDTSSMEITEMKGDLLRDDEKPVQEKVEVDVSGISVADRGSDMGQKKGEPPPPPPNTDHLSIDQ